MKNRVLADLERLRKKHKRDKYKVEIPNYKETDPPKLSNARGGKGGFRNDPLAYRWKKGREETFEVVREIESKRTRIAPLFNKGAYGYLTPEIDATTIGRK